MLGLTFRFGDSFTIYHEGQRCRVTVTKKYGEIRLTFDAPKDFDIIRDRARVKRIEGKRITHAKGVA